MSRKSDPKAHQIRRDQILSAAAEVFAQNGYQRATTKQIAAAAGLSEGLLYTYFDNKASLLVAMLNGLTRSSLEHMSAANQNLHELIATELTQSLTRPRVDNAIFAAVMSEILVNTDLRRQYREQRLEISLAELQKNLRRRMAAGEIGQQDADILARALSALVLGLGILRIVGDPLLQPESPKIDLVVEMISQFVLRGLAAHDDVQITQP